MSSKKRRAPKVREAAVEILLLALSGRGRCCAVLQLLTHSGRDLKFHSEGFAWHVADIDADAEHVRCWG